MELVKIQYPKSEVNPYWDGKVHCIRPNNLLQIDCSDYFCLQGYDFNVQNGMMTILKTVENHYQNVPVNNNEELNDFLAKVSFKLISTDNLDEYIGLAPQQTVEQIRSETKSRTLKLVKKDI